MAPRPTDLVPPLAVAVVARASRLPTTGREADEERVAIAVAVARAGYFLVDVVPVPSDQTLTGPGWARARELVARARAEALFVDGLADLADVEAMTVDHELVVRHVERPVVPDDAPDAPVMPSLPSRVLGRMPPWVARQALPAPPRWAHNSVAEDGGITHEKISPLRPTIYHGDVHGWGPVPTEVSLSVMDLSIDGHWFRTRPIIQIEGGSYDLAGARQLRAALNSFLALVDNESSAAS